MAEKDLLLEEIQALKDERRRLQEEVKSWEQLEVAAEDSFNAYADYLNAKKKTLDAGDKLWEVISKEAGDLTAFILDDAKRIVFYAENNQPGKVSEHISELKKGIDQLAELMGVEVADFPEPILEAE